MRRFLVLTVLAMSAGMGQAASPFAQWREWPPAPQWSEGPRTLQRATFAALDTNYDFVLSRDEAAASRPVAINFAHADLDGNSRLSPLEFNNIALALGLRG